MLFQSNTDTHRDVYTLYSLLFIKGTLCGPMDYAVHGILQARILDSIAFPFFRVSSKLRDWTQVSHIIGRFFTSWATRDAQGYWSG